MSVEWVAVLVPALIAVAAGTWKLYVRQTDRHKKERETEEAKRQEAERAEQAFATLVVDPFLRVCDLFQGRLYNLLCLRGLVPLRDKSPGGEYAEETLHFAISPPNTWRTFGTSVRCHTQ